jgi:hypothetical protein
MGELVAGVLSGLSLTPSQETKKKKSQEERPILWEVIVSVILNKKVYIYMYPIPKGFIDSAISLNSSLDLAPNVVLPSHV